MRPTAVLFALLAMTQAVHGGECPRGQSDCLTVVRPGLVELTEPDENGNPVTRVLVLAERDGTPILASDNRIVILPDGAAGSKLTVFDALNGAILLQKTREELLDAVPPDGTDHWWLWGQDVVASLPAGHDTRETRHFDLDTGKEPEADNYPNTRVSVQPADPVPLTGLVPGIGCSDSGLTFRPRELVAVDSATLFANATEMPIPDYPIVATKARIAGLVIVELIVDTNGEPACVQIVKPLPFGMDQAALAAVRQWRFRPFGMPVRARVGFEFKFR